jgi:hypothetical protein
MLAHCFSYEFHGGFRSRVLVTKLSSTSPS